MSLVCRIKDLENAKAEVTKTVACLPTGWVNVNADGTIASSCGEGVTASRTGLGLYILTPPAGAETVQLTVIETPERDSIEIHPSDFVGSLVSIHEGDNGATAGVYQDRAFTAVWFGPQVSLVTEVVL